MHTPSARQRGGGACHTLPVTAVSAGRTLHLSLSHYQRRQQLRGGLAGGGGAGQIGDCDLDLNPRLNRDGRDLLHDLRGRVQVDDALVDAHLEAVPCLGTLTARRLARCNAQYLCGEAHGTGHLALQSLLLSAALEVGAHCVGSGGMGVQTICQAQCSQVKWFFAFHNL